MLRRIAIFTIMLCLAVSAKAQDTDEEESNPVVDSLLREYAAATSDTARLRLCWEIAAEGDNVDTVLRYAQIGVPLCSDGDSSTLAGLYGCQGWAYSYKEKFDSSIECYKKAVQIFRAIGNDSKSILHLVNLSRPYYDIKSYSEVWRTLYEALNEAQQISDTVNICYCYYTIADYYNMFKMKQQGIEAASKVYQLAEQSHNYDDMVSGAVMMSILLCNDEDAKSCRESIKWSFIALECYKKAKKELFFYSSMKGDAYDLMARTYLALAKIENNDAYIDSASHYTDLCEGFFTDSFMIDDYIILCCHNRGMVKFARHDYKGAVKELHKALTLASDNDIHIYDKNIYKDLAQVYDKLGDCRKALKYYDLYRESQAPLRGSRAIMEVAAFEVRSVVEQEQAAAEYEKLNAAKELESGRRHFSRMLIVSAVGFVALLTFIFILWRMLQNTRKGNAALVSHNEEIKAQNEELNIEKANFAAINDKIRQGMRYARRIQMATVSSEAEIEEVFANSMVYNKPCEIVSGDWYWASRLGSKRILALGGSDRFGVPGALVSMMTVNALKDTIGQLSTMSVVSPTAILRTMKSKLPEAARNNAAGVSLCVFGRGSIRFAGVNQNAVLIKNGNTVLMNGDKPGDMFYTLTEGDVVMMYSASTKRELLDRDINPESLFNYLAQQSPVGQKGAIEELVSQRVQKEDITVVSIII